MWALADRWVKAVSDVTVGTVIVLVHVALADRTRSRTDRSAHRALALAGQPLSSATVIRA
jgi:hypothetical protein